MPALSKQKKGLTLIEAIIALAIAAIIFMVAFSFQTFGMKSFAIGKKQYDAQFDARMAASFITRKVRPAISVILLDSVLSIPSVVDNDYEGYIFINSDNDIEYRDKSGSKILTNSNYNGGSFSLSFESKASGTTLAFSLGYTGDRNFNLDSEVLILNLATGIPNVSDAVAVKFTLPSALVNDTVKPEAFADVQTATNAPGQTVKVRSNEPSGMVYIIKSLEPQIDLDDFDAAVAHSKGSVAYVTAANTDIEISTAALVPGAYNAYAVDAAGNISSAVYGKITVTPAEQSSECNITSFSFESLVPPAIGEFSSTNISLTVPQDTDISNLIASFSSSAFSSVKVGGVPQVSGVTPNDFSSPVRYTVIAQDGTTKEYVVTVTKADVISTLAVTKLGDGTQDLNIGKDCSMALYFSEKIEPGPARTAIEHALKSGANGNPQFEWSSDGTVLTIKGGNSGVTFKNDVEVEIEDKSGNKVRLLLIDTN